MHKKLQIGLFLAACAGMIGPAFAAGYLELGDIKGESADDARHMAPDSVKGRTDDRPAALLVPAVQKVRDAAARPDGSKVRKKGNVKFQWKVEEGQK